MLALVCTMKAFLQKLSATFYSQALLLSGNRQAVNLDLSLQASSTLLPLSNHS